MSDSDLASLNLSQLRKLASEHQVNNRSRLAKQDLIQALAQVVTVKAASERSQASPAAKAAPAKAETPNKAEPKASSSASKAASDKAPAESKPATVKITKPLREPEVLDAQSVAAFVSQAKPSSPASVPASASKPAPAKTESAAAPTASSATDAATSPAADSEAADPRRRRRRGRGRGRGRQDRGDEAAATGSAQTTGEVQSAAVVDGTVRTNSSAAASSSPAANTTVSASATPAAATPTTTAPAAPKPTAEATSSPARPAPEHERRAPKPRLDNRQLRSVSPILNRLKSLSGGLLELCDPDTPSWAQARLSELLAEAGVHPTPCQGLPHTDFHEVLGTVVTEQVEDGHIAVIEAPGFSLRGDRGDLFALRKAKVRVAGKTVSHASSASPAANPTVVASASASAGVTAPAPVPAAAKSATAPVPAQAPSAQAQHTETKAARPQQREQRSQPSASPVQADADKESETSLSTEQLSKASVGPVIGEPVPVAATRAHRAPKASQAALLPLEPQPAAELDQRGLSAEFGKLGLHKQIQADLHAMGFENPSPIQEQCIPLALSGNDIIGQAQTGTGKTAAFVLPILHQLYNWTEQGPVALITCPTRELAKQVHREFVKMAGQSAARAALIYGGVSMDDQFDALATNPHVVIGTPGRLIDHIKRKTLDLSRLKMLVLDEADQMLDIGFLPDIEYIFNHSNPDRQCLLFSATMAGEILRITQQYQKNPAHVHVRPEFTTADSVDQKFIAVDKNKKNDLLAYFIDTHNPEQLVVFCKTKAQTDRVTLVLKKKKKKAAAIHGDLPQSKRERTLQDFREGKVHCLIATNVAARGLDIPAISHVVNYDIPENPDEYVHRIGRTGRMGASGVARTFITSEDGQFLVEIEKLIGFELEEEQIEGFTASTIKEVTRSIADTPTNTPRLLKPLVGGIRLGRRRR